MKKLYIAIILILISSVLISCQKDEEPLLIDDGLSVADYVKQQGDEEGYSITETDGDMLVLMPYNYDPDDGKDIKGERLKMRDDVVIYDFMVRTITDVESGTSDTTSSLNMLSREELAKKVEGDGLLLAYIEKEDNEAVQIVLYGETEVME